MHSHPLRWNFFWFCYFGIRTE